MLSSQKDLEREAALKHPFEELEAKKKEVVLLENHVKDLEQRLQLADSKSKEKVSFLPFIDLYRHMLSSCFNIAPNI